ncbi:nose resistant to fluoxetine protein 6-like [Branchiostoma lanceolatum]|uniref:nose resistant to fluoxetine protein 6-like n=1 Tax=Branchiostoma lanceolatum TaxID=7740 RepID=UPI003453605C
MKLLLCLSLWSASCLLTSCQLARVLDLPGQLELLTTRFQARGLIQQQASQVLSENFIQHQASQVLAQGTETNWTDIVVPAQPTGNVSPQCRDDVQQYMQDLLQGKFYALNILDAGGKPPSGILEGNFNWLGSYSQCINVTKKGFGSTFDAKYYIATLAPVAKPPQLSAGASPALGGLTLRLGVCVPNSCTTSDVIQRLDNSLYFRLLVEGGTLQVTSASSPTSPPLHNKTIAAICVCSVILMFVLMGTAYDVIIHQPRLGAIKSSKEPEDGTEERNGEVSHQHVDSEQPDERTHLINSSRKKQTDAAAAMEENMSCRVLLCFSLYTNIAKLLSTSQAPGAIKCLHGIRFLSMTWVILGHTYAFASPVIENPLAALDVIGQFTFQAVGNAYVSVDSFFFLSGLLTAYLLLKQIQKSREKGQSIPYWMMYVHRYWRLTMPYAFVLFLWLTVYPYMFVGPFWPGEAIDPTCGTNWWTNLLYINNVVSLDKMCMGWSWYLANDMQFFVIGVPLVYLLSRWRPVGFALKLALLLSSFIATALICLHDKLSPNLLGMSQPGWMEDYYVKPWCRIGPYLVGMTVGWLMVRIKGASAYRKTMTIVAPIGWAVSTAAALAVLYGLYGTYHGTVMTNSESAFYLTVHRTVWALALGWLVLACFYGYGGAVNTFLSWDFFVPLSRLTYCAYLVHPMIIYMAFYDREVTLHYTTLMVIYSFVGNLVLSYGLAFLVSVTVEAPLLGLEKIVFRK